STVQTNIGYAHFCARRYDRAIEYFEKVIAYNADSSLPYWYLGASFYLLGRFDEMMAAFAKALELDGDSELAQKVMEIHRAQGMTAAFVVWNRELEKRSRKTYVPAYNLALLSALLKDREKTFANLKKAHDWHDPWLVQVTHDPEFDFVRDDPRFRELVAFSN
ncbi:MAG: tetratricopeptide repeat protein, partial [Pyrinomonadaceae bacterium]